MTMRKRRNHSASFKAKVAVAAVRGRTRLTGGFRGGPRNSDSLLRWDPDPGEGVWHATEETELEVDPILWTGFRHS